LKNERETTVKTAEKQHYVRPVIQKRDRLADVTGVAVGIVTTGKIQQ
jgi:hypothetical protein